ncbi:MAG: hypothetical protein FP816_03100 [Desulfobacteraceae bacterium]|nr:hypothetical protein [Desulfobacteraceae bacterium]
MERRKSIVQHLAKSIESLDHKAEIAKPASMQLTDLWPWFCARLVFLFVLGAPLIRIVAEEPVSPPFRIGFSSSMLTDVNENEARASVKGWGELIAKEQNVPMDPDPACLESSLELIATHRRLF